MTEEAGKAGYVKTFDVATKGIVIDSTTAADPCVITTVGAHGFVVDDVIWIQDVETATDLNNAHYIVTAIDGLTFTLGAVNAEGFGAGSGGTATKITATLGLKNWTCPQVANMGDITDFESSGLKEFLLLLKEWSGTFDGSLDGTPLTLGSTYVLCLGMSSSHEYYGSVIISSINPGVTVDGVNALSYSFQGTGLLTYS